MPCPNGHGNTMYVNDALRQCCECREFYVPDTGHIRPGNVFVRRYGSREQIHVYLSRQRSAKRTYMRLSAGSVDSTWANYRYELEKQGWRYVGTIPAVHLNYLERNWTLR
jgi:hypothetical protein